MNINSEKIPQKRKSNFLRNLFPICKKRRIEPYNKEDEIENEESKSPSQNVFENLHSITDQIIDLESKEGDLLCPICLNYFVSAVTTKCGHTFCEICLHEFNLYFNKCLVCSSNIRKFKIGKCLVIDSLVKGFINYNGNECQDEYGVRLLENKEWNIKRRIKNVTVGELIDVRDPNYVWCKGSVQRILYKYSSKSKYLGWSHRFDEEIAESSVRLAPMGFYTYRNDIPSYYQGPNKNLFFRVKKIGETHRNESNNSLNEGFIIDNLSSSSNE